MSPPLSCCLQVTELEMEQKSALKTLIHKEHQTWLTWAGFINSNGQIVDLDHARALEYI